MGEPALATRAAALTPCNKGHTTPCNKGYGWEFGGKEGPCNKGSLERKVLIKETPQKEEAFARMAISFCKQREGEADL